MRKHGLMKIFLPLFLAAGVFCIWQVFTVRGYAQEKIIAVVNNDVITQKDFDDFLTFTRIQLSSKYNDKELDGKIDEMRTNLLDKLIEDKLILQEAKKNKIQADPSRIKGRLDEIKKNYSTETGFRLALLKQGLSEGDIENKIKEQILMHSVIEMQVRSKIVVYPGEVTDFYQSNIEKFKLMPQREVFSLVTEKADLASRIFYEARSGSSLEDLAKKYEVVTDKLTVAQDGSLRKEIEEIVFILKPNEVSRPVKMEDKYYLFRLDNVIPSRQQSLADAQNDIYGFLSKKMQEAFVKWLNELRKNSYIKISQG
ncbi:MAG: peptidyl-prolyl cis-trans isomerase [Candidatus Omnitrophota bacterium]